MKNGHGNLNSPHTNTHTFFIPALDCPEEYALIDKGLTQLAGIHRTMPDYLGRSLRVEFDPVEVNVDSMEEQLRRIGFSPFKGSTSPSSNLAPRLLSISSLRWSTIAGGVLIAIAAASSLFDVPQMGLAILLVIATGLSGWHVAKAALRALRLRSIEMNVLMTIAAIGAMATGDFFEAATAMFLFSVSLWLESFTLDRARNAVKSLIQLTPSLAHRIDTHGHHSHEHSHAADHSCAPTESHASHRHVRDIDPNDIRVADLLLIKPGERIPVDGSIAHGASVVNESPITGESMPIEKTVGDWLYAGSLNGEGSLEMNAATTANDSTLAQVARLVEQAQSARSPTEKFVDRFARYYTPVVVAIGLMVAFLPPILTEIGVSWFAAIPWWEWLHRGLVLLVIACPCALVISTPVTIICGLHQATRFGLLIKGGEYLDLAGRLRCVAFDKTGTLTEGRPTLVEVRALPGFTEQDVLRIAAALESASEHPLGAAIVAAARDRGWMPASARNVTTTRGAGITGDVDGHGCFIGSAKFALGRSRIEQLPAPLEAGTTPSTIAVVGRDEQVLGAVYLADRPRSDAKRTIHELKLLRVENVVMLTGDGQATAERIASELGIANVHANLLPQDKVQLVQRLVAEFDTVAMVGDGVNDAPALAAARLGLALGTQASHTALETADVVSLSPHVSRIPELIRLGRRTHGILIQNITFALAIKLGVLCLAAVGLGTLWAAVVADVGASMLVMFNGMRLLQPVVVPNARSDSPP